MVHWNYAGIFHVHIENSFLEGGKENILSVTPTLRLGFKYVLENETTGVDDCFLDASDN